MKRKKLALFSIMATLLFIFACAQNYGPGVAKTAALYVGETWPTKRDRIRVILRNAEGVFSVEISDVLGPALVKYDSTRTNPEKFAQLVRGEGYKVEGIKLLD